MCGVLGSALNEVQEIVILGGAVNYIESGIEYEADPKHREMILEFFKFEVGASMRLSFFHEFLTRARVLLFLQKPGFLLYSIILLIFCSSNVTDSFSLALKSWTIFKFLGSMGFLVILVFIITIFDKIQKF